MKPQPMLTVRFVKRFLIVFLGGLALLFIFPDYSEIICSTVLIIGVLLLWFLKGIFPKTQITVDEETIFFKREFPFRYPLKKYYLHELVIPHTSWDSWIKVIRSNEDNEASYYYLFFKDQRLRFVAGTTQNTDLEFWVQNKFPDRPLEVNYRFGKFSDQYEQLKERNPMNVF